MHERILTGGCSTTVWHDSSINSESWDNSPGPATEPTQRSAAYQSIVQWCRNWADLSPLKLDHVRYRTGLGISGGESEWALRGWPGGFNFKFVGILTPVTRDPYCPRATSRSGVQSSDEKISVSSDLLCSCGHYFPVGNHWRPESNENTGAGASQVEPLTVKNAVHRITEEHF